MVKLRVVRMLGNATWQFSKTNDPVFESGSMRPILIPPWVSRSELYDNSNIGLCLVRPTRNTVNGRRGINSKSMIIGNMHFSTSLTKPAFKLTFKRDFPGGLWLLWIGGWYCITLPKYEAVPKPRFNRNKHHFNEVWFSGLFILFNELVPEIPEDWG